MLPYIKLLFTILNCSNWCLRCIVSQGAPDVVSDVSVMLDSVAAKLTPPSVNFAFTLTWSVPYDNFDPIQNYTITIGCDGSGCPVTLTADGNATSIDIMYNTVERNISVSVTASNTVGTSDPTVVVIVAPRSIGTVNVECSAVDLINLCSVTWHPLSYGPNAVQAPLTYLVGYRYFAPSIRLESVETMNTTIDIKLPSLQSDVFFTVEPRNAFGAGAVVNVFGDEIMSPSVLHTTSNFVYRNVIIILHDLIVECDIDPTSTADYCEVVAEGPDVVTASATIINDTATVTVSSLWCEETYTIKAGGTVNQTLQGPRLREETVIVGDCPVIETTMTTFVSASMSSLMPLPTDTFDDDDGDNDIPKVIVGAVVGSLCAITLIAVIIIVVVYLSLYRFSNKQDNPAQMRTAEPDSDHRTDTNQTATH